VDVVRKGYSVIKRISLLITAALVAAMMMVATAAPAFADPACSPESKNPNCITVKANGSGKKVSTAQGEAKGHKDVDVFKHGQQKGQLGG
jgi:hypothetical protein